MGLAKRTRRFSTPHSSETHRPICTKLKIYTVKSRPLAALVDKLHAQIMCQKPGKTLIPIDKPQVYFVDVVKCVNEVCSQS